MNKKSLTFIGIIVLFFVAVMIISVISEPIRIERYDAVVTINDAGDMQVTERWEMVYNTEMRVRFRDIGYAKYAEGYPLPQSGNNIAEFDQNNVGVRVWQGETEVTNQIRVGYSFLGDLDELGYRIECEPASATCESLFVDALNVGGLLGKFTFEYSYTILGAITEYSDISELNWILFNYMESTVQKASVQVLLPENTHSTSDIYVWGHGLSRGTIQIVSNNEVAMEMEKIKKTELLEFRILMPKDLFPNIMAYNRFLHQDINKDIIVQYEMDLANETNTRIVIAQMVLAMSIAIVLGMGAITYHVYKKYDKEYTPTFDGDYYRELPSEQTPAEMSYLYYFKKTNDEDVTATMLDLIRRKYILLEYKDAELTKKDADFTMVLNIDKKAESLKPHEYHIVNWFFHVIGDGKKVTTTQIENYGKKGIKEAERFQREAKEFVRLVKKECEHEDFFEDGIVAAKGKALGFLFIPIIGVIIAFFTQAMFYIDNSLALVIIVVTGAIYAVYVSTIKKRSVNGNELFTKWKAFRNFLVEFGNFSDYPMPGIIVWEHFLVYATSLKVADKVMEQLKVKLPINEYNANEATFMGAGYRTSGFYYGYAFGRFNRTFTTAKTNSVNTITSYHASKVGSTGSGGGFGGGRSFGGGGGGGRSR